MRNFITIEEILFGEKPEIEKLIEWEFLKKSLKKAKLTFREKEVIERTYWKGQTLRYMSLDYGCSQERIRGIKKKALQKLASIIRGGSFRDYDYDSQKKGMINWRKQNSNDKE